MGFNRILALGFIISVLALGACGSAKKTAKAKVAKKIACPLVSNDKPHLTWYVESTDLLDSFAIKRPMAAGARIYSLDSTEAKSFFALFKDSAGLKTKLTMALPLLPPNECKTFDVSVSRVMAPKLRQRYPDVVAIEGRASDGKGTVRLNWDGKQLKMQATINGEVTQVNPVRHQGQTYYLVYNRAESPDKKEPFEETGNPHNGNKK